MHLTRQATKNFDEIDLDAAVRALKIPKRRIYDVINILEGAGVLERRMDPKNTFRWAAPLIDISTEQLEEAWEQEEKRLDSWIDLLENRQEEVGAISSEQLEPLLGLETSLLAVHVPENSFIRTVHPPYDNEEAIAFKLTTPASEENGRPPKAYMLENGDTKFHPVAVRTALSPSKAAFMRYSRPLPSSPMECQDPNPLDALLKALPKPPPKAGLSYSVPSLVFEPIEVLDEEGRVDESRDESIFKASLLASGYEQRDESPFEASLLRVSGGDEERRQSPFEALLQAALCDE